MRTTQTMACLLVCLLIWLGNTVPAHASVTVQTDRAPDGRLVRVVIKNDLIRAAIDSAGGRLIQLANKQTNHALADEDDSLMQGLAKRRDWVTGLGELISAPHDLTIEQQSSDTAVVRASYEATTGNFAGLRFDVVYRLAADQPVLEVVNQVTSLTEQTTFDLNIHNLLSLSAFNTRSTYFHSRSDQGLVRVSLTQARHNKNNLIYNVKEPWLVLADHEHGHGLAVLPHDASLLDNLFFWAGESNATLEWTYKRVDLRPVAARDEWEASYSLIPVNGLGTVVAADRSLISSLDTKDGQGVLGLFSPSSGSATVTIANGPTQLASEPVVLTAGRTTNLTFTLPRQAGVHDLDIQVDMPDATIAFSAPLAVQAERTFAGVTQEIRKPLAEGVHGFYYYFNQLSLSPDVTVPMAFGLRGQNFADLNLVIEAPRGVEIVTTLEGIISRTGEDLSRRVESIEVDGQPYVRYHFPTSRRSTYYSALKLNAWLEGDVAADQPVYYYAQWKNGQQARQPLPLRVVRIDPTPALEQIRVGLELGYERDVNTYHNLIESFQRAGLNWVAGGIASWNIGVNPRMADGALKPLIEPLRQAGLHVSTGNLGYPYSRFRDVWEKRHGTYELASTLYYPETSVEAFDLDDTKAVNVNGDQVSQMCPSYRGRFFEKTLDNVRLLIDYGYTILLYDEETWSNGREVCYCERCLERFAAYLAEHDPDLEHVDPRQIAADPDRYPAHYDAWWNFRTAMVAEIYDLMKQTAVEHGGPEIEIGTYVSSSVGGGKHYGAVTHRLTNFKQVAQAIDFQLPMAYSTTLANSRWVGQVAGFLWHEANQYSKPYMALSPARTYEYERIAQNLLPPAEAVKYQMFESFAQGTQGIMIWAPASALEGALSFKHMSDAIRAIAPVEDIVVHGNIRDDLALTNTRAHATGMVHDGRSVIMVAEYSNTTINTNVTCPVDQPRSVRDLETGQIVGRITPENPTFQVTLTDRRARLFAVQ